jgi:hypothetical protein
MLVSAAIVSVGRRAKVKDFMMNIVEGDINR